MAPVVNTCVILLAVFAGYMIGTSPPSIVPPFTPDASPTGLVPPWPIFRVAVYLNDFFRNAAEATTMPNVRLIDLATGYWQSSVTMSLASLSIIEELAVTPKSCDAVAQSIKLNGPYTCRLMTAAAKLGLLVENAGGLYSPSAVGALMDANAEGSMKEFVKMINRPDTQLGDGGWNSIHSGDAIKQGKGGFEMQKGVGFWEYAAQRPEIEAEFDGAMSSFTAGAAGSIMSSYKFSEKAVICDIGGGEGATLAMLLSHYPDATGIVVDRESVIPRTVANFESKGLSHRARGIAGDFFNGKELPVGELATCDAFVLKHILHDWSDASAVKILTNVKAVAKAGAKLLIIEHIIGGSASSGMERAKALMDINMMAACEAGAKERSQLQYEQLARDAGIQGAITLHPMRDILGLVEVDL